MDKKEGVRGMVEGYITVKRTPHPRGGYSLNLPGGLIARRRKT